MRKETVRWCGSCAIAHYFTASEIITYMYKNLPAIKQKIAEELGETKVGHPSYRELNNTVEKEH